MSLISLQRAEEFTWANKAEKILNIYNSIICRKSYSTDLGLTSVQAKNVSSELIISKDL